MLENAMEKQQAAEAERRVTEWQEIESEIRKRDEEDKQVMRRRRLQESDNALPADSRCGVVTGVPADSHVFSESPSKRSTRCTSVPAQKPGQRSAIVASKK